LPLLLISDISIIAYFMPYADAAITTPLILADTLTLAIFAIDIFDISLDADATPLLLIIDIDYCHIIIALAIRAPLLRRFFHTYLHYDRCQPLSAEV